MNMTAFWTNLLYTSLSLIIIVIIGAIIFYLFSQGKLKNQKGHYKKVHQDLKTGSKVVILSGIYGEITAIHKDTVDVKVKSGAVFEASRYAITDILK